MQENAKLYRWETKHRNDHFSLSEESQSQNLDERSVLYQSESLPLDDSIFKALEPSGCERNNLINMVSVYSKTAAGVCQWGHH